MDFSLLWDQRTVLVEGLITTCLISLAGGVLAVLMGLVAALAQKSSWRIMRVIAETYVQFFRNTPLLVQLFFIYKGLPHLGITWPATLCGVVALGLQSGAYLAEIFRSGFEAVPREQVDSGLSLGFSKPQTYLQLILPQAVAIIVPPFGNQMVSLMKNSSLVSFITVPDLFFAVFSGATLNFQYLTYFSVGIVLYMMLSLLITVFFRGLENFVTRKAIEKGSFQHELALS